LLNSEKSSDASPTRVIVDVMNSLKKYTESPLARIAMKFLLRRDKKTKRTYLEYFLARARGEEMRFPMIVRLISPIFNHYLQKLSGALDVDYNHFLEVLEPPWTKKIIASIMKGFAYFGVRRPFTPGAPFLVVWDFTYRCNLRCKHCYSSAGILRPEMTVEERLKALDILAEAGVAMLALSGGEPILGPGFWEVLKTANDYGIYLAMATNGTLITDEVARKLAQAGLRYAQVSLDSPIPEVHDEFRGVKGAWEKTVKGIRNLKKYGITVEVSMTVTKLNYKQVPQMIKFVRDELKADMFMMFNFIPTGRGREIINLDLTPEERQEVLEYLANELYRGFHSASTAPQYAFVSYEIGNKVGRQIITGHFYGIETQMYGPRFLALLEFLGGCGAGRMYCALEPNGDIQPCVFMPIKVGNILKDDFEELWRTNKVFEELRNRELLKGECANCQYKYICGGCRARAYAYFGDYLAPDPGCIFAMESWQRILKEILGFEKTKEISS